MAIALINGRDTPEVGRRVFCMCRSSSRRQATLDYNQEDVGSFGYTRGPLERLGGRQYK